MRFSIKDVFVLVALSAAIFSAGAYVGFGGFYPFVLIVSAAMTAIFVPFAARERGRGIAVMVPLFFIGIGALLMMGLVSMALLINAVLLLILGTVLGFLPKLRGVTVLELALACAAIAVGLAVLPGYSEKQRFAELRAEFPEVSLVNRLKYETITPVAADPLDLSDAVLDRLASRENKQSNPWHSREQDFRKIHDWNTEMFARSIGFGVTRMTFELNDEWLRKPPLKDIPFNAAALGRSEDWCIRVVGESVFAKSLHDASEADFINRDGFGAIVDGAATVIGFVEHALHQSPRVVLKDSQQFTIERLELVSLLKHGEPRVYVLDHMPRMDQLSAEDAPTRALDEFETGALKKLRTEEDVIVAQDGNNYRMLGSLRATTECVQCHSVQRGKLLGAFSYVIRAN
jgi:hypothetical protein